MALGPSPKSFFGKNFTFDVGYSIGWPQNIFTVTSPDI